VSKHVGARQDTLIRVFNRIEYYFRRLEIYTTVPVTVAMRGVMVDIMVEVISFLAIVTKELKQGRTSEWTCEQLPFSADLYAETYFKKLVGITDVEDVLQRLDELTQEESHMASVELLRISHTVGGGMTHIGEGLQGVDRGVRDVGDGMRDVREVVQGLDDKVFQVNRASSPNAIISVPQPPQTFPGDHLRDDLRTWLSPPNPSTNHNIACDAQHKGTSRWFFRSTIFTRWNSTGSFLWLHGKRMSRLIILDATSSDLLQSHSRIGEEHTLVCQPPHRFPLSGTDIVM